MSRKKGGENTVTSISDNINNVIILNKRDEKKLKNNKFFNENIYDEKQLNDSDVLIEYSYIINDNDELNEEQLNFIIELDENLILIFNKIKEMLKNELNLKLKKENNIDNIEKETYNYLNLLELEKINLINEIIKSNYLRILEQKFKIETIRIPKPKPHPIEITGGVNIKYKYLKGQDEATDVIKQMCTEHQNSNKSVFNFINDNKDQRIRYTKDDKSNDIFDSNPDMITKNIEYSVKNIDPISGNNKDDSTYKRNFKYHEYNKELLYYTQKKLINNNDLIKRFVDKQIEYLKTLELFDRLTVNDYTKDFYIIFNYWKIRDPNFNAIKTQFTDRNNIEVLGNFLNPQIYKVLKRISNPVIDPNNITNTETILSMNNIGLLSNHLDEIFKQYEIDLNRIIGEAPPRIYSFEILRGAKTDYIYKDNENIYYLSNRFSSFTIDIFEEVILNYASEYEGNPTIYETLLTPTAKVLFVSPLSQYNYELEILQASNQVICKSFDKSLTKIYIYRRNENYEENKDLLCVNVINDARKTINIRSVVIA